MPAAKKGTLQLRLHAPATPDHVVVAASMFRDLLSTTHPVLSEGSITMVVSNFDMTAGLRYQDQSGRRVLEAISKVIRAPAEAVNRRPALTAVADILSEYAPKLVNFAPAFWSSRGLIRSFDEKFVHTLSEVVKEQSRLLLWGDTIVYSPVYRVGRTSDKEETRARIEIDGQRHDIRVKKGSEGLFFDAAKNGDIHAVYLEAAWYRNEHGNLELDTRRSRAVSAEVWEPATDTDLMQEITQFPHAPWQDTDGILDEGF